MTPANISQSGDTDIMDRVKRNAEIVALVKARKMPMRKIAARYRLSVSRISEIATKHRVYVRTPDPKKMPLMHVAQRVGLQHTNPASHFGGGRTVYPVPAHAAVYRQGH